MKMKLLLTSTGITNKSIEKKFFDLVSKKAEDIRLAYIPTAINMAKVVDKRWMIHNLERLDKLNIGQIDIVDFTAVPVEVWSPRLNDVDVWFVEGGDPFYLLSEFKKAGLVEKIKNIENKVYVGCSAGSMMLGKLILKSDNDSSLGYKMDKGLDMIGFSIRAHFGKAGKHQFNDELMREMVAKYKTDFYAIDDATAISIDGSKIEVISEGIWKKFEK